MEHIEFMNWDSDNQTVHFHLNFQKPYYLGLLLKNNDLLHFERKGAVENFDVSKVHIKNAKTTVFVNEKSS